MRGLKGLPWESKDSLVAVRHPDLGPCREGCRWACRGSDQWRQTIVFVDCAASQLVRNPVNKNAGPFFLLCFVVAPCI